jgi:deoxyadenosine/deoxycytidine kinase
MRVLIVGVCSSGKSTLEQGLQRLGYDAHSCVQEHSYVPDMWRTSQPDLLVYLDATLDSMRRRGETDMDEAALAEQHEHLAHARQHCDLYIRTDRLSQEQVLRKVRRFIDKRARA